MMHNRFLSKCGVSLACLVSVWGMGAYAKTTELFRFPVNIPAGANGADGCSAKVTAGSNGCTEITERTRVNGACQDTSNVRTVCPGEQGNSCSIKSVSTVDNAQKVTFNCGDPDDDTEITIPNGAPGTPGAGCAVKSVVQGTNKQTVTLRCGNTDSEVEIPNGTPGCTPVYTKTYINKVGDNSPTYNNTTRTDNTIGERAAITGCGDPVYLDTYDGPAGQDSVCSFSSSRNATNGIITFKSTCNGQAEQTIGTLSESDIANNAINKITQQNLYATAQQITDANSAISALQSGKVDLTTHNAFVTSTNAALDNKVDQDDFDSAMSDVYDKDYIDGKVTELNASITSAAAGVSEERLSELISQTVNGQYASTSDFNTLSDTVNDKLNKDQLATELGKTTNANAINSIINSNSTVTGLQSTLSTVQTTANNALPKNQLATEVGKLGYASASDLSSLQTTLSTVQTTANNALPAANFGTTLKSSAQSSNLATALGATAPTATINGIIDTNSTVAGKASQSALDTLAGRVTANETAIAALPNEERVAQIAANAANAAALCTGTITTRETTTENGKTVEVICTTNDQK